MNLFTNVSLTNLWLFLDCFLTERGKPRLKHANFWSQTESIITSEQGNIYIIVWWGSTFQIYNYFSIFISCFILIKVAGRILDDWDLSLSQDTIHTHIYHLCLWTMVETWRKPMLTWGEDEKLHEELPKLTGPSRCEVAILLLPNTQYFCRPALLHINEN